MSLLFGFTQDDALISARMAHHLAIGAGYRMNLDGPVVDAVTPLGFAHFLAPFARTGPLAAFSAARLIGALAWLVAAAVLGGLVARVGDSWRRFLPLVVVAISAPLGGWASSGMETGIVVLLASLALVRSPFAPLAAGLAAAWRPELLPWAMTLGAGTALARTLRPGPAIAGLVLAFAPAVGVGIGREIAFGTPMPLSALAKQGLWSDGVRYALGAAVFSGLPLACVALGPLRRLERHRIAILFASFVHLPALVLAGGDAMPLYRLIAPVLPGFALAAAAIADRSRLVPALLRTGVAIAASLVLLIGLGPSSRNVWSQRRELIESARAPLSGATHVASIDIGWIGATTRADVVDLAGVADPEVARLAGGHTSRRLPSDFLQTRHVDAVLALWDERRGDWYRYGDARVVELAEAAGFERVSELSLRGSSYKYVLFRLR